MHLTRTFVGLGALLFSSATTASAANSPGCGKALPKGIEMGKTRALNITTENGRERLYRIHVPSAYREDKAVPLIFSFHGRKKTAASQEKLSQFSNETWNPNGIAVYPQGVNNQWQGDPDPRTAGINDIAFTMQLLNHLESQYCLDTDRIYATGKSNGGGLTNLLACDKTASTRIAAFAPVSGAYYQDVSEDKCNATTVPIQCSPGRKDIPILEFHGSADGTIPYNGGPRRKECLPSVPHFVQEWARRDGLGMRNKTRELFDGHAKEFRFGVGKDGKLGLVTHYWIEGLGHAWPSTRPNSDNPKGTYFDATPVIMEFFEKHSL